MGKAVFNFKMVIFIKENSKVVNSMEKV